MVNAARLTMTFWSNDHLTGSAIQEPVRVSYSIIFCISVDESNLKRRDQRVTDARKNPLPDDTPREGSYLYIHPVHIPPSFDNKWLPSSAFERITVLDHENYRTAWVYVNTPHWLLNAERWQALVVVEGGKTRYETIEVFGGVLAYFIKAFVGNGLKKGFVAMAERLKSRAEERYEGHT